MELKSSQRNSLEEAASADRGSKQHSLEETAQPTETPNNITYQVYQKIPQRNTEGDFLIPIFSL